MIIRLAKKDDLEEYSKLRNKNFKEYYRKNKKNIILNHNNLAKKIKKEFYNLIKAPRRYLLLVSEGKILQGFLIGSEIKNVFQSSGYIDDIYVGVNYRRKGIASNLIKEFFSLMKIKKIKKFRLGVDIKNKEAINLYLKAGFKITQYEMEKIIKWLTQH